MNLQPLFETQKKLDERIVKEKGLEGAALLDKKILALQVELGELANEWRGFKFWSEKQEPRTKGPSYIVKVDSFTEEVRYKNPLLEEYVDCLHFILSIGNDRKINCKEKLNLLHSNVVNHNINVYKETNITKQFNTMFIYISTNEEFLNTDEEKESYEEMFLAFIGLGEMLGFTWQQIEQAYYDKNKVNHERQSNGY